MSYSVFPVKLGKLYVKDYAACNQSQALMSALNRFAYKIEQQDDLFCLLGSTMPDGISKNSLEIVASVFLSQNVGFIRDQDALIELLNEIGIDITDNPRGYWHPNSSQRQRIVFTQGDDMAAIA